MTSFKTPMSTSYKAVFVLSILMIFVVIIGGAVSGSKTSGFGIWYWGYTVWKMYKRDNESLVSLQKVMLWFEAIAFSVSLAILLFSDSDVRRYVDVTPLGLVIIATISLTLTFFLYKFFRNQLLSATKSSNEVNASLISDENWEQASRELDNERHEATWAKALASTEGDNAKARALYIKNRASDLQRTKPATYSASVQNLSDNSNVIVEESKLFWSSFNGIGKLSLVAIVALIGYAIYDSSSSSKSTSLSNTSVPSASSQAVPSTPQKAIENNTAKPIKSIDEVSSLCYVYWDGRRWQSGKTEGDKFKRLGIGRYGVEVIEAALPIEMAKEFGINTMRKDEIDIEKGRFGAFMQENWYQLDVLCKLR